MRSECSICPPWVLRCVHFEGQILVLGDFVAPSSNYHTCHQSGVCVLYEVHLGSAIEVCQRSIDCEAVCIRCDGEVCTRHSDLPAAEAEFERRAEELRQDPVEECL